jgi:glutamate dehydrogenase/leucine dehydrogenase
MDKGIFDLMESHDYENIIFCQEKTLGLRAIIVIHDTTLGPAAGGIRMWPYESQAEAIRDMVVLLHKDARSQFKVLEVWEKSWYDTWLRQEQQ